MQGTVKWFNLAKGFGFIVADGGEQEVFVHQNALTSGSFLRCGDRVKFEVVRCYNGPRAQSVTRIEEP